MNDRAVVMSRSEEAVQICKVEIADKNQQVFSHQSVGAIRTLKGVLGPFSLPSSPFLCSLP